MPRKDWETEFEPNTEEYKSNSSLQRDISCVVLQKTDFQVQLQMVTLISNWE